MAKLDDLVTALNESAIVPATIRPQFYFQLNDQQQTRIRAIDPANLEDWCLANNYSPQAFRDRANSYRTGMGTSPGRGYILVTRGDLTRLQSNTWSLVIAETNERRITISNLQIERAEAIFAGYDPDIVSRAKTSSETVYLLHLVDVRDARGNVVVNKSYNLLYGNNTQVGYLNAGANWTVRQIIQDLAADIGFATVDFQDDSDTMLDFAPEGYRFIGVNGLDSLNSFLHAYQLRMSVDLAGNLWIIPGAFGPQASFDQAVDRLNTTRIVAQKGFDHTVDIPAQVKIYFPNRDFQFQLYPPSGPDVNLPTAYSPEEVMHLYPFYERVFTPTTANSSEVHHLWAALPRVNDDNGTNNESALESHGDQLGARHEVMLAQWDNWKEYTYSGLVAYQPTGLFSGVAWWDFGDGLYTKLYTQPVDFNPHISLREFSGEDFLETVRSPIELAQEDDPFPSPPDVTRKHPVIPRMLPGVCTESPGPVQQNQEGAFALYFGVVQGSSVSWNNFQVPITAFPFFSDITTGSRVILSYNWQLGAGGRWIAYGFQAGSGAQQQLSAFARATATETFSCAQSSVTIGAITYMSPDYNSLPWPGPPTSADNIFGLSGTTESTLLLMWDRTTGVPVIAQVLHDCQQMLATGITHDLDNCQVLFPTRTVHIPKQTPFVPQEPLQFVYKELVKRVYWDNDKCTLYYQTDPVCVLEANRQGTPEPTEGVQIYDLREIRDQCLPCDACPCDCADFDTSIKLTITNRDQEPADCTTPHTDPACRGNFDGLLCQEITLDEVDPTTAPDPCGDALNPPGLRVWKGELECPNSTGDPPKYDVYVSCDPSQSPIYSICVHRSDTGALMDQQPAIICGDECGCFLAEGDMDWGNQNDLCGNPVNASCFIWWWVNLLPSKGGYFCCRNNLPSP